MKAVVKARPGPGIEVKEVRKPVIKPGEALIKVKAVGICGSDIHIYKWDSGYEKLINYIPLILGHEFSGEVVELKGVADTTINVGDRVTSETGVSCKKCLFCKIGRSNLCKNRSLSRLGLERNGAMAEYVAVPVESLHKIPDNLSYEEAAITEPAGVALHAVELAHLKPADKTIIIGPGPIGLLILQAVKILGAIAITAAGLSVDEQRLEVARELGAETLTITDKEDIIDKVKKMTDGVGADVVFDTSGSSSALSQAIKMVRPGGKIILVGIYQDTAEIDATSIVRYEISIHGSYAAPSPIFDRVLTLMSMKKLNTLPLITHRLPLTLAEEGFKLSAERRAIKTLLIP